jgi:uncharacterized protein YndB with AHSA1/START domain
MMKTHETEITVDPKVPLVRITREFDASPEKVFRAHTDPDLYSQWIGPRKYTTRIDRFDCRTGGAWRFVSVAEGEEHAFHGSFHEVAFPVIVQTFTYEGFPGQVSLERLEVTDLGDGRTRLTATSLVDSFEARDAFVASGMESGVREGYERLDELLAR